MSGGKWDYVQHRLEDVATDIVEIIRNNDDETLTEWGDPLGMGYDSDVLKALSEAISIIRMAALHIQRADWLFSGDDDEDSYLRRLSEETEEIMRKESRDD